MVHMILAMTKNRGIGFKGKLPWYLSEELKLFKSKTINKCILVGSKTLETLPYLDSRNIYCLTRKPKDQIKTNNPVKIIRNINDIKGSEVIVAGGAKIYDLAIRNNIVDKISLSVVKGDYTCDTHVSHNIFDDFVVKKKEEFHNFSHYDLVKTNNGEKQYLNLIKNILTNGHIEKTRNGKTISTFANHLQFDLRNGFPLITTKKMFTRGILEELLFFLRGDTNTKYLEDKGINIWKDNTSREFLDKNGFVDRQEGVLGPMYGYQFRNFNAKYDETNSKNCETGFDQFQYVLKTICTDPTSRRILMTSFNPLQMFQGVLFPCHSIVIQFYVQEQYLDMYAMNRSSDVFLGLPFNIAYYGFLLELVAKMTNKQARMLNISLGDTHIYPQHILPCKTQYNRIPYHFPKLSIVGDIKNINDITVNNFKISNYQHHSILKAPMIA